MVDFLHPIFLLPILVGIILIITGLITLKFPPKKINSFYGYRTKNSMKDIERWNFAQQFSSKLTIKLGFFLSLTCLITMNVTYISYGIGLFIGLALIFLVVILLFTQTEKAIRSKFK